MTKYNNKNIKFVNYGMYMCDFGSKMINGRISGIRPVIYLKTPGKVRNGYGISVIPCTNGPSHWTDSTRTKSNYFPLLKSTNSVVLITEIQSVGIHQVLRAKLGPNNKPYVLTKEEQNIIKASIAKEYNLYSILKNSLEENINLFSAKDTVEFMLGEELIKGEILESCPLNNWEIMVITTTNPKYLPGENYLFRLEDITANLIEHIPAPTPTIKIPIGMG